MLRLLNTSVGLTLLMCYTSFAGSSLFVGCYHLPKKMQKDCAEVMGNVDWAQLTPFTPSHTWALAKSSSPQILIYAPEFEIF